jgi:hypothetical protein
MKLRFNHTSLLFLVLILLQALHSTEEYIGRLWENFPPATFLTGLVSENHQTGFLIINVGILLVGLLLWAFVVHPQRAGTNYVLGFWITIEIINGIGHPVWAVRQGGYEPGVITAPLLLIVALLLLNEQIKAKAY